MSEHNRLLQRYKSTRAILLFIIVFSALNIIFAIIGSDLMFVYSLITPQLAIAFARVSYTGITSVALIIVFGVIPVLLLLVVHLLSAKNYKWLTVACGFIITDLLALIVFIVVYGFAPAMIANFLIEGFIIVSLLNGVKVGKQLDNNYQEDVIEEYVINTEYDGNTSVYFYDKQLAKENKTTGIMGTIISVFGFVLALFIDIFVMLALLSIPRFSEELAVGLFFALLLISFIVFFIYTINNAAFLNAKYFSYYKDGNSICRLTNNNKATLVKYENLKVVSRTTKEFKCTYTNKNGKTKKYVIPNCYPNIENILY